MGADVGGPRLPAAGVATSAGGRQAVALGSARARRPRGLLGSVPRAADAALPPVAELFGWLRGPGTPAVAAGEGGGAARDGLWLAVLAAGLLGAAIMAARAVRVPIGVRPARDRWRSLLEGTRAAGGELGEALPLFLILLLVVTVVVLWIVTT